MQIFSQGHLPFTSCGSQLRLFSPPQMPLGRCCWPILNQSPLGLPSVAWFLHAPTSSGCVPSMMWAGASSAKKLTGWCLIFAALHLLHTKLVAALLSNFMLMLVVRPALHSRASIVLEQTVPPSLSFPHFGSSIENPVIISCKFTFWSSLLWEWVRDEAAAGWAFLKIKLWMSWNCPLWRLDGCADLTSFPSFPLTVSAVL